MALGRAAGRGSGKKKIAGVSGFAGRCGLKHVTVKISNTLLNSVADNSCLGFQAYAWPLSPVQWN